ncbi:hypothetical protein HK101_004895 [Irineochytrium annulatum]|nr:hypothetical protein HK101_004895 [Irineochytrium annulatum]
MEEWEGIKEIVGSQVSREYTNEMISEINEFITDKRFNLMDFGEEADTFTLEELLEVPTIGHNKIKVVLVALLHLKRIGTEESDGGAKRYYVIGKEEDDDAE